MPETENVLVEAVAVTKPVLPAKWTVVARASLLAQSARSPVLQETKTKITAPLGQPDHTARLRPQANSVRRTQLTCEAGDHIKPGVRRGFASKPQKECDS